MKKRIISIFIILALALSLTACGAGISDRTMRKILKENGYTGLDLESLKVEYIANLDDTVLNKIGVDKLVLVSQNDGESHGIVAVNTETKKTKDLAFGYNPLNIIENEIFGMGKNTNIENTKKVAAYINQHGFNCFENKAIAEDFLREITSSAQVIDVTRAREAIEDSLSYIFPDIGQAEDSAVFFEENCAVPLYYAALDTTLVYNWSGIFDESVYKVWDANMDYSTKQTMAALYGPPYSMAKVWAVVDADLNQVGTFDSLDEVRALAIRKNQNLRSNNKSSTPTTTPSPTATPSPAAITPTPVPTITPSPKITNTPQPVNTQKAQKPTTAPKIQEPTGTPSPVYPAFVDTPEEEYFINNYYRAKCIFVKNGKRSEDKTNELIGKISQELQAGKSFDSLIKIYSDDLETANNPNGYFLSDSTTPKDLLKVIKETDIGEVTQFSNNSGHYFIKRLAIDETEKIFNEGFLKNVDAVRAQVQSNQAR